MSVCPGLIMRITRFFLPLLAFVGPAIPTLAAQDIPPIKADTVPTYHVYPNLVQTEVVVLSQDKKPMPPIPESRFFVSLDGGPRFRVTHARLEGADPISLAILLDLNQPSPSWLKNIDDAIASLVPLSLTPRDQVSIYSLDCQLISPASPVPAKPATLKRAVDEALQSWTSRGQKPLANCREPSHLRDSLMAITQTLQQQPGHRVILVISDGSDRGNMDSWNSLRLGAQSSGVAIFCLTDFYSRNYFNPVWEQTGGMILTASRRTLATRLEWFTTILRGRYIVEFPRAVTTTAAYHRMDITIDKTDAFVRPSGILVPIDDPAILNDPMTLHPDPSHAPKFGRPKPPSSH